MGPSTARPFIATSGNFVYQSGDLEITRPIYFVRNRPIGLLPAVNILVKPHEYWPYNPNDGLGPIYDKVTGEQLRPFPS